MSVDKPSMMSVKRIFFLFDLKVGPSALRGMTLGHKYQNKRQVSCLDWVKPAFQHIVNSSKRTTTLSSQALTKPSTVPLQWLTIHLRAHPEGTSWCYMPSTAAAMFSVERVSLLIRSYVKRNSLCSSRHVDRYNSVCSVHNIACQQSDMSL